MHCVIKARGGYIEEKIIESCCNLPELNFAFGRFSVDLIQQTFCAIASCRGFQFGYKERGSGSMCKASAHIQKHFAGRISLKLMEVA